MYLDEPVCGLREGVFHYGDQFRFEACTPRDALTALIARERAVLVVERDGS